MILLSPLSSCVTLRNFEYFFVFLEIFFNPQEIARAKMGKSDEKTNTGEGGKGKKGRTVSDDAGG